MFFQISDAEFDEATKRFPFNTPRTKESFYYRTIFEEFYPSCDHFTPYIWLPKWCGSVVDPSARVLNHYNEQQKNK
jgi:asparagine synthase (glutamine-hydrolysing)